MKKYLPVFTLLLLCYTAQSHSGRTDSDGGHYNRKTGGYHYHNGGSSGGGGGSTRTATKNYSSENYSSQTTIDDLKAIQKKLNELGFDCGEPDGIMGAKTKQAIKDFQKSKGLTADGILGEKTRKELGV